MENALSADIGNANESFTSCSDVQAQGFISLDIRQCLSQSRKARKMEQGKADFRTITESIGNVGVVDAVIRKAKASEGDWVLDFKASEGDWVLGIYSTNYSL
ncbi:hypothetical protein K1719_029772 [Acacia pycnantha]|nr:hypothetical protein K1719_029772 [Acacia pycnantha]